MSAPEPPASKRAPVVIVGGGVTGLAAAWRLRRAGASFVLLESSGRLGGKILTEHADGFTLELGADAFLTRKPWAIELARDVGLGAQIQLSERPPVSAYVLHQGHAVALPEGFSLLAPTRWPPFLASPLFSPRGKLRAALDLLLPRRKDGGDESLAAFVTRRLGPELLQRAAEPMMAGIFNAPAEALSMQVAFGQFLDLEQRYGSVIRGLRKTARRKHSGGTESPFFSFMGGAGALANALASNLSSCIRTSAAVESISEHPERLVVHLHGGERIPTAALVLTTSAHISAALLRSIAPHAASNLAAISHSGIGSLHMGFRREDVAHPLDAYGLLIPREHRRVIDGVTFSSTKFAGRAPEGHVLLRAFFGGVHTREALELDEKSLLAAAREQLGPVLGLRGDPVMTRIHRWPDAYPQYHLGHLDRVAAVESSLPGRVAVAGCAMRGVGVPDCIRQGQDAADRILSQIHGNPR